MNQVNTTTHKTKIGELIVGSFNGKLCLLDWKYRRMRTTIDKRIQIGLNAEYVDYKDDIIENATKQIEEYLRGERNQFDVPLLLVGTEFQKSVWGELLKVPYGQTSTYAQLAKSVNNEKAVRAVASANGANALSLIVPCHRIIGSNGDLVGYAGGLPAKKRLLKLESA